VEAPDPYGAALGALCHDMETSLRGLEFIDDGCQDVRDCGLHAFDPRWGFKGGDIGEIAAELYRRYPGSAFFFAVAKVLDRNLGLRQFAHAGFMVTFPQDGRLTTRFFESVVVNSLPQFLYRNQSRYVYLVRVDLRRLLELARQAAPKPDIPVPMGYNYRIMFKISTAFPQGALGRASALVALAVLAVAAWGQAADAKEPRTALVIGNGAYKYNTVLSNPANDATDMAAALKASGFDVMLQTDCGLDAMNKALREFGNRLKARRGVGLFYYSGHGVQINGQNYLLAVDQDIAEPDEVAYKALDADAVLAKMESAGGALNLVFLDACRNNPFPGATRAAERGLAPVKTSLPETVIVYATDPGKAASDGDGRNSPFTQALLRNMSTPGQDILAMMKKVTVDVGKATMGKQTPWLSQKLTRDFAFTPGAAPVFGAVGKAPGRLEITVAAACSVSVLGKSQGMPAGGLLPVDGVAAGACEIKASYPDGYSERRTVEVPAGGVARVAFAYAPYVATDAGRRVALVIGNGDYGTLPKLPFASNDARDIAAMFSRLGFEVAQCTNFTKAAMDRALADFYSRAAGCDTAVLYYSGHGANIDGEDYLMGIDLVANSATDIIQKGTPFGAIKGALARVPPKRLIAFLDSARNNPFGASGRGLSLVKPTPGGEAIKVRPAAKAVPAGLAIQKDYEYLCAFATSPGGIAEDGNGHGAFTEALLKELPTPGISIEEALRRVYDDVFRQTAGRQKTWTSNGLTGGFWLAGVLAGK
jgi:uncharacterized caspase-like protein